MPTRGFKFQVCFTELQRIVNFVINKQENNNNLLREINLIKVSFRLL